MGKAQNLVENNRKLPQKQSGDNKNQIIRFLGECDRPFLILVILLMALGSVMMFSASYAFAEQFYGNSYFFAEKQIGWIIFGIAALWGVTMFVRPSFIRRFAFLGYLGVVGLNLLVWVIGFASHGAVRQLDLGFVTLQPSELLKTFNVIICAKLIADNPDKMKNWRVGILPFAVLGLITVVICFFQSHLSAMIINLCLILFMMLIGGSNAIVLGSVGAAGVTGGIVVSRYPEIFTKLDFISSKLSHVYQRLLVWQDPFKYMKNDELGDPGWQPSQSLYAISSGRIWGVGLGKSIEKHGYLPEPHNDYVFAIVCEELGFAGAVFIICLFGLLVIRGFQIANKCRDKFNMLIVMGLTVKVAIQVILNIAVVTNTIPSTGVSLPFFSYGGTSLIILMAEMGIILSISRFSYLEKE